MKVVLRQIDAASVLRNEGVGMAQLSPRLVELQPRPARQPDSRDPFMVQRSRKFIKPGNGFPALREQGINRNVENAGSLAQASSKTETLILAELACPCAERSIRSTQLRGSGGWRKGTG